MTRLAAVPLFSLTSHAVMPMTMTDEIQMRRLVTMRMGESLLRPWTAVLSRVVPKAILQVEGDGGWLMSVDVDLRMLCKGRSLDVRVKNASRG